MERISNLLQTHFQYAYTSPLGTITLTYTENAITQLSFAPCQTTAIVSPVVKQACNWLDAYFTHQTLPALPPLQTNGTNFQKLVWRQLQNIAYGHTATYGQIAQQIASVKGVLRMSAQAVGNACAKNPILLMIPCHRIIGANGHLTGFAAGTKIKHALLKHENIKVIAQK